MRNDQESYEDLISEAETLFRSGRNEEVLACLDNAKTLEPDDALGTRALITRGAALYDLDAVTDAIATLRSAVDRARKSSVDIQFSAAFALFTREGDFQSQDEAVPALSELRQMAASLGNPASLGALHLAVARREGMRGNCMAARRHTELARRLSQHTSGVATLCSLDTVESSLELMAGNLDRARHIAESGFARAAGEGFSRYVVGCATNLSAVAILTGDIARARKYIDHVVAVAPSSNRMKFCVLDNLLQISIFKGDIARSEDLLNECSGLAASVRAPRKSWYELSHQWTRCLHRELLGEWDEVIAIVDHADNELGHRQLKALHTTLLCAKARALSRLDRHDEAEVVLVAADKTCPREAVEPLIMLEASKGLCRTLRGESLRGSVHFERALAACRAIGHSYHAWWIDRSRPVAQPNALPVRRRDLDLTGAALLLSDVTTILGAGHSIDLLAHRTAAVLQSAFSEDRIQIRSESGREYLPEFSANWEQSADGTFRIRLRGSDRSVSIEVRDVQSLDEVSLVKSVADLVRAAVNRTADTGTDEDDQNLWPRSLLPGSDDAVFRSPRMTELLRIAIRLAATDLPILIGGETGTGKEVFARLIHEHSRVKRGPFVAYNCSAMPRDLVESQLFGHRRGAFTGATDSFPGLIRGAEHGTLFLDEIGDLDPLIQPKLLRFLEGAEIHPIGELKAQRVPVRIVAATNANLDDLVEQGRFRSDLFYRLSVARLSLPPLRERKDEIPALAALFLTRYSSECRRTGVRLGDDLIAALLLYDWPGNIRQIANEIRRVVAMADDGQVLHSADLAPEITKAWNSRPIAMPSAPQGPSVAVRLDQPLDQAIDEIERKFIERAMDMSGGRVAEAAQLLGISRKGLFLKRRRWGLVEES